ncbi:polysaccharide deacetylase family protein [Halomonas nitroreducens]|nr:polysaccharide deacetylase family protein [Halomonas nitroreducens]
MSNPLTIVMYHYVRPLHRSRYPELKALELSCFRGQLDFIGRHYTVVDMEQVIAATRGEPLPPRPLLLTFDDGYRDHYEHVVPLLVERGWQGSFFPPACAVREGRVLDVNKVHFTLASVEEPGCLVEAIFAALDEHRGEHDLADNAAYFGTYAHESRYDGPEVTFVKRMLQKGLPDGLRERVIERLFRRFVTTDEADFAADLYMSVDQLREIHAMGMCIGSHGDRHRWLNTLPGEWQRQEVDASLAFLGELGVPRHDWVMCYPYGGYDDGLLAMLRERGCALGLTVEVDLADVWRHDPLRLPRVDTNDLPAQADAVPGEWAWVAASSSRWGAGVSS